MRVKDIDFVGVGWEWLSGKGRRKEWKLGCMAVALSVVSMEETAGVSLRAATILDKINEKLEPPLPPFQ